MFSVQPTTTLFTLLRKISTIVIRKCQIRKPEFLDAFSVTILIVTSLAACSPVVTFLVYHRSNIRSLKSGTVFHVHRKLRTTDTQITQNESCTEALIRFVEFKRGITFFGIKQLESYDLRLISPFMLSIRFIARI